MPCSPCHGRKACRDKFPLPGGGRFGTKLLLMSNASAEPLSPVTPPSVRVTVARYNAEEVSQNFQALYDSLDYRAEIEDLGFTPMQFKRRKKALREFKALSVGLWGLALQRSFPEDAPAFFSWFQENSSIFSKKNKESTMISSRVNIYVDLLASKKDTDFLPVAQYLVGVIAPRAGDTPRLHLKLSLSIRSLYTLIFDKLV